MTKLFDQYSIEMHTLTSKVKLPNKVFIFLASLFGIFLNILLGYYIGPSLIKQEITNNQLLIFSIVFGVSIFVIGLYGGKFWQYLGFRGATATYIPFVKARKFYHIFSKLYVKFVEEASKVYLEAEAKDSRLKGPISLFKLIIRISLSQLGFYVTVTALIVKPYVSDLRSLSPLYDDYGDLLDPLIALAIAVIILGLYLPMSILIEDSNLRTFNTKTRFIGTPASSIRSFFDTLVGIGAISTGWSIFSELRSDLGGSFIIEGDTTLLQILDYISWLLFIMIISWPLIFPAAIYYFVNLEKNINNFRLKAIENGIKIGVTMVREPTSEEYQVISEFKMSFSTDKKIDRK